jgi:hypothetical protein
LLDRALARALTRQHRYSADTLRGGIYRLTERATATFTSSGLRINYPPSALHVAQPRVPRPGVDLVAAFDDLVTSTVARLAVSSPAGQVGVDFLAVLIRPTLLFQLQLPTVRSAAMD